MARIDLDTEIVVENNRRGIFTYNDGRGSIIELSSFGDNEYVSMRTLKSLSTGRDKGFLRNFSLLVTGVNDDEVTLEDVLKELRLTDIYEQARKDLGIEDITSSEFEETLKDITKDELVKLMKNKNLRTIVAEIIIELYRKGEEKLSPSVVEYILTSRGVRDPYSFMEDIRRGRDYKNQ